MEYKRRIYRSFYRLDFKETKEIVYEILAEEMEESINIKRVSVPAMKFGTIEEKYF